MAFSNKSQLSATFIWAKTSNLVKKFSYAVGEEYNISYFTEIIYFWFCWLLNNNEWPLPPKSELLCSMDKHNFPPQLVPKCGYLNDDSNTTMEW